MNELDRIERQIEQFKMQARDAIIRGNRLTVRAIENKLESLFKERDHLRRMQGRATSGGDYLAKNPFIPDGYFQSQDSMFTSARQEALKREYEAQEKAKEKTLTRRQRRRSLASAINVEH